METINISRESLPDVLTDLYEECAAIGATFTSEPTTDEIIVNLPDRKVKIKIYDILDGFEVKRKLFGK